MRPIPCGTMWCLVRPGLYLRLPAKQFNHYITLTIQRASNCIILKYGIVSANIAEIARSILLKKVALFTILQPTLTSFIDHSNTPSLYTQMVKCSDILSDKSLGGLVLRYLVLFGRHFDFFVTSTIPSALKRRHLTR